MDKLLEKSVEKQQSEGGVKEHLNTVKLIIQNISKNITSNLIGKLKAEVREGEGMSVTLAYITSIARVIRTVNKALRTEEQDPLIEKISKPPKRSPVELSNSDKAKIKATVEVSEYIFIDNANLFTSLLVRADNYCSVIDSRPVIQLLVAIKKVLLFFLFKLIISYFNYLLFKLLLLLLLLLLFLLLLSI